jgi:S-adenosylmethionine decarboxylase proenzyme
MHGLHVTADLFDCACNEALLTSETELRALCLDVLAEVALTPVGERFHTFPGEGGRSGGVTGMVLLAESHLALHTWPELQAVTLDVYVCNFQSDNSAKAEALIVKLEAAFAPGRSSLNRLWRAAPPLP